MSAEALLARLNRVRRSGPDSWMASCPGPLHQHGDRHPSLHVTEAKDGTVLIRCFSGCQPAEIVGAIELDLSDLFVPRDPSVPGKAIKARIYKSAVFDQIQHEVTIVWLVACDLDKGKNISEDDYQRLRKAVATLERIREAAYD